MRKDTHFFCEDAMQYRESHVSKCTELMDDETRGKGQFTWPHDSQSGKTSWKRFSFELSLKNQNMGGFRSRREKEEIPGEGGGSAEATVFPSLRQDILHRFKSLQILEEQPGETAWQP